mgnify:CR=1 FL=1
MLVSIHSKSKNSLPLLPLSAKWFVNRRSLLVSPSYPAIEFRAVCVSYCLLHTGVPLVHTSTTCGVLASLFKRLSSVSAFLAASTVTMVAFWDFLSKKVFSINVFLGTNKPVHVVWDFCPCDIMTKVHYFLRLHFQFLGP